MVTTVTAAVTVKICSIAEVIVKNDSNMVRMGKTHSIVTQSTVEVTLPL